METTIRRFAADQGSLDRFYWINSSERRADRFEKFFQESQGHLKSVDFGALDHEGQIDYLLFNNYLAERMRGIAIDRKGREGMRPFLPFAKTIIDLSEARQQMNPVDPKSAATTLNELSKQIEETTKSIDAAKAVKTDAFRASKMVGELREVLKEWFEFFNGYDPLFSWWVEKPYQAVDKELDEYSKHLREQVVGLKPDDKTTIIGDPVGRERLVSELEAAMIPYTPEELIKIANKEFAWCEAEMKKASKALGYGDDWKKALEHVKTLYVEPGKQTAAVREMALEAIDFVEDNDLVTVPPIAKETWRMTMMSPERQLINPFFLGGEAIIVSFPTNTMEHEQKLMSMRGNNLHFSRAVVHHELIPGHHLQGFMLSRYRDYRELFYTPFWIEGWALYWEFLLWDMGFPKTPEQKIGMLFWRMHRCARIIFSLRFHLGEMSAQECVDFLVERVGHERDNAAGEVRRSFESGWYGPLYQLAYMVGGLQFYALHKELVGGGKMTNREFHDRILQGGQMPVELVRARLTEQKLSRDFKSSWRFYGAP